MINLKGPNILFTAIIGIACTFSLAWADLPEQPATTMATDAVSLTPTATVQPESPTARPTPLPVALKDLAITKTSARVDWLTGKIVNHSQLFLDGLSARIIYCDAEGNTVEEEYKRLLKKEAFTYHTSLQPGYSREFAVALSSVPNNYSDVFVDIARVRTNEKPGYTVPLETKLGLGVGWPYGGTGLNLEVLAANYYAVSLGLGSINLMESGLHPNDHTWTAAGATQFLALSAGTRLYFGEPTSPVRGRFGFFYGPTHTFEREDTHSREIIQGYHPSLGMQWRLFQNVSLDLDVEYALPAEHSRDYSYMSTSYSYWYPSYTYTYKVNRHVTFDSYVSPSVGITVHFGDHGKIFDDQKDARTIHIHH